MTTTLTRVRIKDTALDQGEEPHPLQGVTGTVLETFPMAEAGADCLLALDCSHQAAARMFRLGLDDWEDFQDIFRDLIHDPNRPVIEETLANLESSEPPPCLITTRRKPPHDHRRADPHRHRPGRLR